MKLSLYEKEIIINLLTKETDVYKGLAARASTNEMKEVWYSTASIYEHLKHKIQNKHKKYYIKNNN